MPDKNFIIDFDSTFTKVEALDLLAEIALENNSDKEQIIEEFRDISEKAMKGVYTFGESLSKKFNLINANLTHLDQLIRLLKSEVSESFLRNKAFFADYSDRIFIVSNSFREFIEPVVSEFGISPKNIFANTIKADDKGNIIGFDEENILAGNKGKAEQLKSLNLPGDIYVIGDGYTDYEIKAAGLANKFYAFTENIERANIAEKADHVAPSLDEVLYHNKIQAAISYPKNRIHVLLLENVHPVAVKILQEEGYTIEVCDSGMDEDELCERIKDVSVLGIRSKTRITEKVLANANRLIAIGAFCIGTNQIDLEACLKKGVAVFNAPFSNTRSVVELAIGEIILLMRNTFSKSAKLHDGIWDKSANNSFEVRGKTLGIVGYGNIGSQLSVLAEALGMTVCYYDIVEKLALGNARKCTSLTELIGISDVVSLHVDGRAENAGLFGEDEFSAMKDGAVFLNLSRGHIVDIGALKDAIKSGKIIGAGVDVFPEEPKSNEEEFISGLRNLANVILTPHIGGSTTEAQENIGSFVPGKIIDYINTGSSTNSVNFPEIQLSPVENAHRMIHIHRNVPGVLASINQVLAKNNINILGQYLKTNETIGYLILAVDRRYENKIIKELKNIEHTIRFRVLY